MSINEQRKFKERKPYNKVWIFSKCFIDKFKISLIRLFKKFKIASISLENKQFNFLKSL